MDEKTDTQAAIAAAMLAAVKPLEWGEIDHGMWSTGAALGGEYRIRLVGGVGYTVSRGMLAVPHSDATFSTLDAAISAAQADYQARILSALSIPTDALAALKAVKAQVRNDVLDEASLAVANMEIGFYDGVSGDWHPLTGPAFLSAACAAIRAMKGGAQ